MTQKICYKPQVQESLLPFVLEATSSQGVSEAQGYRGELTWHKVFFHPSNLLLTLITALGLPSIAPNPPS